MRLFLVLCASLVLCQAQPYGNPDDYEFYDDEAEDTLTGPDMDPTEYPELKDSDLEINELPPDDYIDLSKVGSNNDDDDNESPEFDIFDKDPSGSFEESAKKDPNFIKEIMKQMLISARNIFQGKPEYAESLKKVNEYFENGNATEIYIFIKGMLLSDKENNYQALKTLEIFKKFIPGLDLMDEETDAATDSDADADTSNSDESDEADDTDAEKDDEYDANDGDENADDDEDEDEDEDDEDKTKDNEDGKKEVENGDGNDDDDDDDDDNNDDDDDNNNDDDSEDGDKDEDNSTPFQVSQEITDTLDYLADPDIPKAVQATEQVNKVKNETVVTEDGFEFMNMTSRFQQTKGLRKKHLLKQIKREFGKVAKDKESLKGIVEDILDHVENGKTNKTDGLFAMISDSDFGMTRAVFFYYKERNDGKYNIKKLSLEGTMKLAASLVITRITEGNSTYSESKDIISYVPRENSDEIDVMKLLKMIVPDLGKILKKLTISNTNSGGRSSIFG